MSSHRIMFFGDDVVAGAQDASGRGLVGRLIAAAHGADIPVVGFNLGVPGDTSLHVSRRWRKEAAPRTLPGEPWWPVFCCWSNDPAAVGGSVRVEPHISLQALQKILSRTREAGLSPLIIGPPPRGDEPQRQRTLRLSERLADLSARYAAAYIETASPLASLPAWSTSAAALDEAGCAMLAELVLGDWLRWLRHGASLAVSSA